MSGSDGEILVVARLAGGVQFRGKRKFEQSEELDADFSVKGILKILNMGGSIILNPSNISKVTLSATIELLGASGAAGGRYDPAPQLSDGSMLSDTTTDEVSERMLYVYGAGVSLAAGSRWVYQCADELSIFSPKTWSSIFDWELDHEESCDIYVYSFETSDYLPDYHAHYHIYALKDGEEDYINEFQGAKLSVPLSAIFYFDLLKKFLGLDLTLSVVSRTKRMLTEKERKIFLG
jgi:hypothetical protein